MPHVIWDEEDRRPYVHRDYPSREVAERELAGLLKPYPTGHPWRARLVVREGTCGVREPGRPTRGNMYEESLREEEKDLP